MLYIIYNYLATILVEYIVKDIFKIIFTQYINNINLISNLITLDSL